MTARVMVLKIAWCLAPLAAAYAIRVPVRRVRAHPRRGPRSQSRWAVFSAPTGGGHGGASRRSSPLYAGGGGAREARPITSTTSGNVSVPEVFVGNDGSSRQLFANGVVLPVGWTGASNRKRTGSKFFGASSLGATTWPVGEAAANPAAVPFSRRSWLSGIRGDLKRRAPNYLRDWADGLTVKTAGAVCFLYFAVLAPAVAFGGVMAATTGGALGPRDVLLSCGLSGMAYATLAGQPMTFVAPTGLTLSFIGALAAWAAGNGKTRSGELFF